MYYVKLKNLGIIRISSGLYFYVIGTFSVFEAEVHSCLMHSEIHQVILFPSLNFERVDEKLANLIFMLTVATFALFNCLFDLPFCGHACSGSRV